MFFFLRFYLFIHERHRNRGRDIRRGRSRLPAGNLMWDSIPGPQDHTQAEGRCSATEPLTSALFYFFLIFKKDFIYLFMRGTERQRPRQREKQAPCREPDAGLYPGTPESRPGLKAEAPPLSPPGVPWWDFIKRIHAALIHIKSFGPSKLISGFVMST